MIAVLTIILPLMILLMAVTLCKFRNIFWVYLFLFPLLYYFFFDQYLKLMEVNDYSQIPSTGKMLRDFMWFIVLYAGVLWILLRKIRHALRITFPDRKLLVLIVIYIAYIGIQAIRSVQYLGAFGACLAIRNTVEYLPMVVLPSAVLRKDGDVLRLMKFIVVFLFIVSGYAIIQYVFNIESRMFISTRPDFRSGDQRIVVTSFFNDYNMLACVLVCFMVLVVNMYRYFSSRIWVVVSLVTGTIALLLTQSRTGIITLYTCLIAMGLFKKNRKASFLLIMVATLFVVLFPGLTIRRIQELGISGDARYPIWITDLYTASERPFLGHGLGLFGSTSFTINRDVGDRFDTVDNFYLMTVLNLGLIGLVLFLAIVYRIFRFSCELLCNLRSDFFRDLVVGSNIGIFSLLVFSISFSQLEAFPANLYFWFLVGLVYAIAKVVRDAASQPNLAPCSA